MLKVFLADDEPWVLLGLKNLIDWGRSGFVICGEATDGVKAWERICRMKPDLVLSDIQMPGLTGLQMIEKLREAELDAEVVVVSGYSEFEYAQSALKLGCMDYLLKPVEEEALLDCLDKVRERISRRRSPWKPESTAPPADSGRLGEKAYQSERRLAQEIIRYIHAHFADINQTELAAQFCLSPSAVSQIIKKHSGKTYGEQLLDVRMQKAQELLRNSNDSIEAIAEKVGYHDYFYFLKVFKKAAGISPTEFRKML